MKVNPNIHFDNRSFFDKQELRKYIEDILNSDEDKDRKRKEDLFDLYRSGEFERFCGLKPTESELIPALQAIKNCLELNTELSMHLGDYCSIKNIKIEGSTEFLIGVAPISTSIQSFIVSPFYLTLEAIKYNNDIKFVFSYNVQNTVYQKLAPSLVFVSEGKPKYKYASNDDMQIDLSKQGQSSISFTIPALDVFTQGEGYYILKFGASELASVKFPRCGLPIYDGIYSFLELRDFCSRLNGSPTDELFSFYELINIGLLDSWLQDNQEEGIYKKKISEYLHKFESAKSQFKINDINTVLELLGLKAIVFPMSEYFSVVIKKIGTNNIIGKQKLGDITYYFFPWNLVTKGLIDIAITPKRDFEDWNIDFEFDIRTSHFKLTETICINLKDIGRRKDDILHFCIPTSKNARVEDLPIIVNGMDGFTQPTNMHAVITGETIEIQLSSDTSISMVGIYSLDITPHAYYIAQTTLTQKQVRVLIEIAKEKGMGCDNLKEALNKAISHDGNNDLLPCSYLHSWRSVDEINNILNSLDERKKFLSPKVKELDIALHNGTNDRDCIYPMNKSFDHLQPVSKINPIHSTRLGILDLLGNILSITDSTVNFAAICSENSHHRV